MIGDVCVDIVAALAVGEFPRSPVPPFTECKPLWNESEQRIEMNAVVTAPTGLAIDEADEGNSGRSPHHNYWCGSRLNRLKTLGYDVAVLAAAHAQNTKGGSITLRELYYNSLDVFDGGQRQADLSVKRVAHTYLAVSRDATRILAGTV